MLGTRDVVPGVSGVSSEGVGLDSSVTDARGAAGVGLTFASWGACGRVSVKVGGEKGGRSSGEREERGAAPFLWSGLGVVGVGLLPLWTVVLVSTSSAVLGVDSAGSTGAGEGTPYCIQRQSLGTALLKKQKPCTKV